MEGDNKLKFPFEFKELNAEETEEILNCYNGDYFSKFLRVGPKGYFFFDEIREIASYIYNMQLRTSDNFIVTFPRSGTTWTQELIWLLNNNLDFEKAKADLLAMRFPFIESAGFSKLNFPSEIANNDLFRKFYEENFLMDFKIIETMPSPRFIKSHTPLSLLPPSLLDAVKVVYVARDPRDVAVSNFYHMKSMQAIPEEREFKPFWKLFMEGKIIWAPYFDHVKEAWRQRDHKNMTFLFYEDLLQDLGGVARRLAKFFDKDYTDDQYEALCNHLKFDNFKNNESVNLAEWHRSGIMTHSFIRKGKSGGWRDHFDEEMSQQAEQWIADNLRDTDLTFPRVD